MVTQLRGPDTPTLRRTMSPQDITIPPLVQAIHHRPTNIHRQVSETTLIQHPAGFMVTQLRGLDTLTQRHLPTIPQEEATHIHPPDIIILHHHTAPRQKVVIHILRHRAILIRPPVAVMPILHQVVIHIPHQVTEHLNPHLHHMALLNQLHHQFKAYTQRLKNLSKGPSSNNSNNLFGSLSGTS